MSGYYVYSDKWRKMTFNGAVKIIGHLVKQGGCDPIMVDAWGHDKVKKAWKIIKNHLNKVKRKH